LADKDYYTVASLDDPTGPPEGKNKVISGGGCKYSDYGLRAAHRGVSFPQSHANFTGFRCALSAAPRCWCLAAISKKSVQAAHCILLVNSNVPSAEDTVGGGSKALCWSHAIDNLSIINQNDAAFAYK
jgi:hypothetical protein